MPQRKRPHARRKTLCDGKHVRQQQIADEAERHAQRDEQRELRDAWYGARDQIPAPRRQHE